jgi:ABC-type glycerol-3-phosphate transport system substrate-binding protein
MKMKKLMATGLAAAMALSLAACGGSSSSGTDASSEAAGSSSAAATSAGGSGAAASGEKVKMTLALRGGTYGDVIKQCLPEFEKENNCDIEVLELEFDDLHSKIALDAQNSKGAYDLVMVDGSWMAEFTENEVLTNLSDAGYSFDDDIIPGTTDICKDKDGNIYLAPYFGNVTVLLYNKDLVKAAGYTGDNDIKSWDDVMKIAQSAKDSGKNGYIVRGGNPDSILSDFIPVMLANGAWVVDDNNKPTVDTPEMKQALTQYKDLAATGQSMEKDDIVAQIDNGDGALAVGWPGWYSPTSDSAGSYCVIPSKLTADGKEVNTSLYGTWCIGVPQNAPDKDLGVKLLEYLMDKDVQLSTVDAGGVPCRYSCLKDENVLKNHPTLSIVCDALEKGVYRPVIAQWNDFTTTFGTEIDNYMQGTESLDDALKNAQSQLELLMQ